jgi:hypothetical protein
MGIMTDKSGAVFHVHNFAPDRSRSKMIVVKTSAIIHQLAFNDWRPLREPVGTSMTINNRPITTCISKTLIN